MANNRRIFSFALPLVLMVMIGLTNGQLTIPDGATEIGGDAAVAEEPVAQAKLVLNNLYATIGNPGYSVMQGGCTDGTYVYYVMEDQSVEGSIDELVKIRISDWSIVRVSTNIDISHGNDMTYNSKTKKIIAVHHKPNFNTISIINPETLKVESDIVIENEIYSIAYNEAADQYAAGICGTQSFAVMDRDFEVLNICPCIATGYTSQGMDCDDTYVYFIQSAPYNIDNIIVVYDWDGNYIKTIKVNVALEGESLCHVGSTFYANFHSSEYRGTIYELELQSE